MTHGIFICQECALFHKDFGIHISFVRSMTMDSWSIKELRYMSHGGNKAFREFLQPYNIPELPHSNKYTSKAANYYRDLLKCKVEEIEISSSPPDPFEGAQMAEIKP